MAEIHVSEFQDTIVIHFGTESPRISAYTLAWTLSGIADAARAANATLNPGYEVEILVEALGAGSFKACIRSVYRGAANLFSTDSLKAIVLGVIGSYVYQHTLAPDQAVNVHVSTGEVLIEQGDTRIVVPREVYECQQGAERDPLFRRGVEQALRAVGSDERVRSIGFSPNLEDPRAPVEIPRERFAILTPPAMEEVADRELIETAELEILRAILERSRRRWEFVWNGVRISAPVLDARFYDSFIAHEVTVAPGDVLRVKLRIRQRKAWDAGPFVNDAYEVIEVQAHKPKIQAGSLGLMNEEQAGH